MARANIRRPPSTTKRWLIWVLVPSGLVIAIYWLASALWSVGPRTNLGMGFGWAAVVLLIMVSALSVRKRMMGIASRWKLGRSRLWLSVHLYGGTWFLLLMVLHSNFSLPDGWVTGWLWSLSVWTVTIGLLGRGLQLWVPRVMTSGLSTEALYERIPELVDDLRQRATALASESCREIQDLYENRLAAEFERPRQHWIYYFDITGGIRERMRPVRYLRTKLSEEEGERLDKLSSLYRTKLELDAQLTLQRTLRGWLWLHVPTSLLLLAFLVLHLWGVLLY